MSSDEILAARRALLEMAPAFKRIEAAAEGGAIFIRVPHDMVKEDQLNGGMFEPLTEADWDLIEPYLLENERLFGIPVESLLTVDGVRKSPSEVYRKVTVFTKEIALTETENR